MPRRLRSCLVAVLLVLVATGGSAPVGATPTGPEDRALGPLESRFLTTRPAVGPTWRVSIAGEGTGRSLTARSLQGLVNRSEARVYLVDGGDPGGPALLDRYVARGLVTVAGTTDLDGMLDRFAGEASGFVLADPTEPWSVHGASVLATLADGIIATPDQVVDLTGRGLVQLDDVRGRWPDAATAYADLAATYGDALASDTLAVVRPTDALWDFVAQQGLLPVFTRPSDPTWSAVRPLLDDVPDGSPVYGYLSDTGEEEAIAVATLAATDLVLVPTDTTRNLSFHVAVGADRPRVRTSTTDPASVAPCAVDDLNVVVGLTDGDNMNVPLNHFLRPSNWDSPRRGDLPLGWSIGPDLAVLAPGAWDVYADEATAADELVAMIGWGYGAPALLPDPSDFYATSFGLMDDLGMRTFWSLGGGLETPGASYWSAVDAAATAAGVPDGVLVGYGNAVGDQYWSPGGLPAMTSRSVYSETPTEIAAHVSALLATPAAERPLVSFLSATNWSNPAHDLIAALQPFEAMGVRFLTPSEAMACLPDAPDPPPPPVAAPQSCLPGEPVVQSGLALISDPAATEIASTPTPLALPTTVVATDAVAAGGTIHHEATIEVDVPAFAAAVLADRVRPVVEAGYGPELADTAWLELRLSELVARFPTPDGTTATGAPSATSTGPGATARWADDGVEVEVLEIEEDSRTPGSAFSVAVRWDTTAAADRPDPFDADVLAGALTFDLHLVVGVVLGDVPLVGAVDAPWSCTAGTAVLATTRIGPGTAPAATPIVATPTVTG